MECVMVRGVRYSDGTSAQTGLGLKVAARRHLLVGLALGRRCHTKAAGAGLMHCARCVCKGRIHPLKAEFVVW